MTAVKRFEYPEKLFKWPSWANGSGYRNRFSLFYSWILCKRCS